VNIRDPKIIVVGAGFYGAVMAERMATDLAEPVLIIDSREHLGGNSWSEADPETGIECHLYGSHIFHTKDEIVWRYISRFASLNHYRHRVLSIHNNAVYPMPVNLTTLEGLYGRRFTPEEAKTFLKSETDSLSGEPQNLEEMANKQVGAKVYDAFLKGYTWKQWGTDPRQLPASTITRLPVRFSYKSDYFDDPYQGIPMGGYGDVFKRILSHPKITTILGLDFFSIRGLLNPDAIVIYTGPVDRYFDYKFGVLGWRTLKFEKECVPVTDYQGNSVINYPDLDIPYTRIHEFRHYHPERNYIEGKSVIFKEYSRACGVSDSPYYPINTPEDQRKMNLYQVACAAEPRTIFGGRLGEYRYLDMDKTIGAALKAYIDVFIPRWRGINHAK